jgi:hypothetical protein
MKSDILHSSTSAVKSGHYTSVLQQLPLPEGNKNRVCLDYVSVACILCSESFETRCIVIDF